MSVDDYFAIDNSLVERLRSCHPYWDYLVERECLWEFRVALHENFFSSEHAGRHSRAYIEHYSKGGGKYDF